MKTEARTSLKLGVMMFMQYMLFAVWWVSMAAYLTNLDINWMQKALILSFMAIGSMASPLLGALADRYFPAQKVLAVSNFITAGLLVISGLVTSLPLLFVMILLVMLCYMPTWSLTSSIAMKHASSEAFPRIRMFGTIGWVASGLFSLAAIRIFGMESFDGTNVPLICGGATALAAGLFNFTLPDTPASKTAEKTSLASKLGFDAFSMLRDRNYLVFIIASFLSMIPFAMYFTYGSEFLQDQNFRFITFTMNWGQVAEMLFLFLATSIIRKMGVKNAMLWGLLALVARYAAFYAGIDFGMPSLFIIAILVHGLIFGLFFAGGQVYTDMKAPANLRASAQGMLSFIVWGVAMLIGNMVCGWLLMYYTDAAGVYDWNTIFAITTVMSVVVCLLFVIFFREPKAIK